MRKKLVNDIKALKYIAISDDGKYLRYPESSAIVCFNQKKDILFVEQYRPLLQKKTIEIPGGIIDEQETALEACKRELNEETGFDAQKINFLFTLDMDVAVTEHKTHVFSSEFFHQISAPEIGIETRFINLSEALQLIEKGIISHAPTVSAILWLNQKEC